MLVQRVAQKSIDRDQEGNSGKPAPGDRMLPHGLVRQSLQDPLHEEVLRQGALSTGSRGFTPVLRVGQRLG